MAKTEKQKQDELHQHGRVEPEMPKYPVREDEGRSTNEADVIAGMPHIKESNLPFTDEDVVEPRAPKNAQERAKDQEVYAENAENEAKTAQNMSNIDIDKEKPVKGSKK